ncbi:hypothetical protein [Paenibacillus beijingensis]|nr:hypothetical protein [Paenibacillus beijingensis]
MNDMTNKQQKGTAPRNKDNSDIPGKGKSPESVGFDKKLDGPNRPAT